MRAAGLTLVCLGALALGAHGLAGLVSPLAGGIALVSGLLLLAARGGSPLPSGERSPRSGG